MGENEKARIAERNNKKGRRHKEIYSIRIY